MTADAKPPLETLIRSLRSGNRHERAVAAIDLGERRAEEALPEMLRCLDDEDDLVAGSACYASWKIDGQIRGVDRMITMLTTHDEEARQLAVTAFGEMGSDVAEPLREALRQGSDASEQISWILEEIEDP